MKLYLLPLMLLLLISFTAAFQQSLPNPVQKNNCVNLTQDCAVCDYVFLSNVKTPTTTYIIDQNMTSNVFGTWEYEFCNTSEVGDYFYSTFWGNYSSPVSFKVNDNGRSLDTQNSTMQTVLIPLLASLLALVLLAISFSTDGTTAKVLRYSSIIVSSLSLYLCFTLDADNLFSIMNAGIIAFGVGSLLDGE